MNRKVLLVDIDEVIFPFAHAYDRWLRRNLGWGLDLQAMLDYDLPGAAGPEHGSMAVQFLNDPYTLNCELPRPGSVAAIDMLSRRFKLYACTSRHELDEGDATRAWVRRHVPQVSKVFFTRQTFGEAPALKALTAALFDAVALVDDAFENLHGLPESCRPVLLQRPSGVVSDPGALSWQEALVALLPAG